MLHARVAFSDQQRGSSEEQRDGPTYVWRRPQQRAARRVERADLQRGAASGHREPGSREVGRRHPGTRSNHRTHEVIVAAKVGGTVGRAGRVIMPGVVSRTVLVSFFVRVRRRRLPRAARDRRRVREEDRSHPHGHSRKLQGPWAAGSHDALVPHVDSHRNCGFRRSRTPSPRQADQSFRAKPITWSERWCSRELLGRAREK